MLVVWTLHSDAHIASFAVGLSDYIWKCHLLVQSMKLNENIHCVVKYEFNHSV